MEIPFAKIVTSDEHGHELRGLDLVFLEHQPAIEIAGPLSILDRKMKTYIRMDEAKDLYHLLFPLDIAHYKI